MYYILMSGRCKDRDIVFTTRNWECFKRDATTYIKNWPIYGLCDTYPSDIIVLSGSFFNQKRMSFNICYYVNICDPDIKSINKLFKEIENYTKEEKQKWQKK